MADVTVYGFPISTYVNVVRLVLTHKGVPFDFHDLEPEMGGPRHLALHPFGRVPILDHAGFRLYETAAIAAYVDEAFTGPALQPTNAQERARMNQWISALNGYYYPNIAFHLGHERLIYPALGIAPDEKVVSVALPKIATGAGCDGSASWAHGRDFLVGDLPDPGRLLHAADDHHARLHAAKARPCWPPSRASRHGASAWTPCRASSRCDRR